MGALSASGLPSAGVSRVRVRCPARAPSRGLVVLALLACLALVPLGSDTAKAAGGGAGAALAPPRLDVSAAALLDADTGQLLYGVHAGRQVAIASTTKLMTALITLEHAQLNAVFTEPAYYPAAADSQIGLVPGEHMTVHDLLLALLLPSADDAAEDLAYNVGQGSVARFVAMMNARAAQLGLTHTHYATPIGLDTPGNYSTATDLATLARYVMEAEPFFRHAVGLTRALLRSGSHPRLIVNRNDLVGRIPWINGVKTGHTLQAGYVLIGAGTRNQMTLISVVLGTHSEAERDATTLSLLRWGFDNFALRTVVRAGADMARVPVQHRKGTWVRLLAGSGFSQVLPRSTAISFGITLSRPALGPLPRGTRMGTLVILAGGRPIGRVPLLLAAAVPAPPAPGASLASLAVPITLVVLMAAVAGGFGRKRTRGRAAEGKRR